MISRLRHRGRRTWSLNWQADVYSEALRLAATLQPTRSVHRAPRFEHPTGSAW